MDRFIESNDIFIEFPQSSGFITSSPEFVMQHSIKRPPEKVLRMPSSSSSSPPVSPDGAVPKKKAPPPVASKPSRPRSSLLSIISNQTGSSSSSHGEAVDPKSTDSPNRLPSDSQDVFEKENQMPPPPPQAELVLLSQEAAVVDSSATETDEVDFPPPPDDAQIQEALDKINSKYDTSAVALTNGHSDTIDFLPPPPPEVLSPPVNEMHVETSALTTISGGLGNQEANSEVSQSSQPEPAAPQAVTVSGSGSSDEVVQKTDHPETSPTTAKATFSLPLDSQPQQKRPSFSRVAPPPPTRKSGSETPTSVTSPQSDAGSVNSQLSLEDELTAGCLPAVGDENHMTQLHKEDQSSFSALDKLSAKDSLDDGRRSGATSPALMEASNGDKTEVNHNVQTKDQHSTPSAPSPTPKSNHIIVTEEITASPLKLVPHRRSPIASNQGNGSSSGSFNTSPLSIGGDGSSGGTVTTGMSPHAATVKTNTFGQPINPNSAAAGGHPSLVGETIQVQLRPIKNSNKKSEYAVPAFDRSSSQELRRVTFQDSSSQPITPAVTSQKSVREQERIKRTGLSEDDVSQTEIFYKGHKTEVMVCQCLATLYFAEGMSADHINVEEWKPEHIGIPVLIYDTGDGKRARGLTMVFAEKGTGFSLWRTTINFESRWEPVESVFHRLRIPGTNDQMAGIAYQDEASAKAFYQKFKDCIADPELNVLNNPNLNLKKKKEKRKSIKKQSIKLPRKIDISLPCQFSHVTQLKQSEDGILALNMVDDETASSEDGTIN